MIAKEADFADSTWDMGSYLAFVDNSDNSEEQSLNDLPSDNIVDSEEAFKTIISGYINDIINRDAAVNIFYDGTNITRNEYIGNGSDIVGKIANNSVEIVGSKIHWHVGMNENIGCILQLTDTTFSTRNLSSYDDRRGNHYKTVMGVPFVMDVSANTIGTFNNAVNAKSTSATEKGFVGCADVPIDAIVPKLLTAVLKPDVSAYDISIDVLYAMKIKDQLIYVEVRYETNLLNGNFVGLIQNTNSDPARFETSSLKYGYADFGDEIAPLFVDIFGVEQTDMINFKKTAKKLKKKLSV